MRVLKLKFLCLQLAHPVPQLLSLFSAQARLSLSINNIGNALRTYCVYFFLFTSVCPLSSDQYLTPCVDHWESSSSFPSPFVFLSQSVSAGHIDGTCGNLQESIDQVVLKFDKIVTLYPVKLRLDRISFFLASSSAFFLASSSSFLAFSSWWKKTHNTLLFKCDTVWKCLRKYNLLVHTHMVI